MDSKWEKERERLIQYINIEQKPYDEIGKIYNCSGSNIRKVANEYYKTIDLKEVEELLHSKYHEERLLGLIILTYKMKKAKENEQKEIVELYINNTKHINGWDLVDLSSHYILGKYLLEHEDARWLLPSDLPTLRWLPADLSLIHQLASASN